MFFVKPKKINVKIIWLHITDEFSSPQRQTNATLGGTRASILRTSWNKQLNSTYFLSLFA